MARSSIGTAAAILLVLLSVRDGGADIECAKRYYDQSSFVCVCNATYCDETEPPVIAKGDWTCYTSTKAALRLNKTKGRLEPITNPTSFISQLIAGLSGKVLVQLNSSKTYQTIEGFGGAVTDSCALQYIQLSEGAKENLIDSYFGRNGYSIARIPLGGCDFSPRVYTYDDDHVDDFELSSFSLAYEDTQYKIPMTQKAVEKSPKIRLLGSIWSPPAWMKSNNATTGTSYLKPEHYQTYADYYVKAAEEYWKNGINISDFTTTNEPNNGNSNLVKFQSLGFTAENLAKWMVQNLCPTLRNSQFSDIKVMTLDDQRIYLTKYVDDMVAAYPAVLDCFEYIAVHWYLDQFIPAGVLSATHDKYPDKKIIGTEASSGANPWDFQKVQLGSWNRGQSYINDIIKDLRNFMVGWMDWNLCLDKDGGPNWAGNNVDSAVIVYPEDDEFLKNPMYYAIAHFSRFVPPGARRIDSVQSGLSLVNHVAFRDGDNVVIVMCNSGLTAVHADIVVDGKANLPISLPASSFVTCIAQA